MLENKLEELQNETTKSSKIQSVKEETITNPVQITTQDGSPVEEKHMHKLKQENTTNVIKEINIIRNPYRHPNHRNICPKNREPLTKDIDTGTVISQDVTSLQEHNFLEHNRFRMNPSVFI